MFSAANGKIKLPPSHDSDAAASSTLRCLLNGPFRDLHFNVSDHRLIPVHDVVFLDDIERNVKPLIYRPVLPETLLPTPTVTRLKSAESNNNNNSSSKDIGELPMWRLAINEVDQSVTNINNM